MPDPNVEGTPKDPMAESSEVPEVEEPDLGEVQGQLRELAERQAKLERRLTDKDQHIGRLENENRQLRGGMGPYKFARTQRGQTAARPAPESEESDEPGIATPVEEILSEGEEYRQRYLRNWRKQQPEETQGFSDEDLLEQAQKAPSFVYQMRTYERLAQLAEQVGSMQTRLADDDVRRAKNDLGLDLGDPEVLAFVEPKVEAGYDPQDIKRLWEIEQTQRKATGELGDGTKSRPRGSPASTGRSGPSRASALTVSEDEKTAMELGMTSDPKILALVRKMRATKA